MHADWSVAPRKRWLAQARPGPAGWLIEAPRLLGDVGALVDDLHHAAQRERILAGVDFVIGLPRAYGERTGLGGFGEFLQEVGVGAWAGFFDVAANPAEIGLRRPFFPAGTGTGSRRAMLVEALGLAAFDELLRACERRGGRLPEASPLFWTLGGKQVGKASLAGWRDLLRPAVRGGARLWPFDGTLTELARTPGLTIAETWPTLAHHHLGVAFGGVGCGKRSQAARRARGPALLTWAASQGHRFTAEASAAIADGFGPHPSGEDAFDGLAGLCLMLDVVAGGFPEAPPERLAEPGWEGWILGRPG